MSLSSSGKLKLGGGGINTLNDATILYRKGQNIKNLDNDNININRVFFANPLVVTKIIPENIDELPYSNISISSNAFYYKNEINTNFQKKLIADEKSGIVLNNESNIYVNFSLSGWTNQTSNIYTNIKLIDPQTIPLYPVSIVRDISTLQYLFGLKLTEAIRFNSSMVQEKFIDIPRSISFNKKDRRVFICSESQKEFID